MDPLRAFVSRYWKIWATLGLCLLTIQSALSYTLSEVGKGNFVRWSHGQKFMLAGNPENRVGLSPVFFRNSVVLALQQWKYASNGIFDFEYWQGTDPKHFPASQEADGMSTIHFASRSGKRPDSNVIGHTQILFNNTTGAIIEADIVLNDIDYSLTEDARDTITRTHQTTRSVYLNNIITHEIGHAIGLSHSSSINSSMLYVEFPEQFKLGCDDIVGAKHLYPSPSDRTGKLEGIIHRPEGGPLAGAVVTAISSKRGIPIASVHTNADGRFIFGALEPGPYSLMVDSYFGTAASIPRHLQPRQRLICSSENFPKNFVTETDQHTLKRFEVRERMIRDIGVHSVTCNSIISTGSSFQQDVSAPFVDRADAGMLKTYSFVANGPFRVTAIGYLLLSPVRVELSLMDASGATLTPRRNDTLYRSKVSDFRVEDHSVSATAFGRVTVIARVYPIDESAFPRPSVKPGTEPLFMMHFHNEHEARNGKFIPLNARCSTNQVFPEYRSPPGIPIRNATTTTLSDHVGFCGTANASTLHGRKSTPATSNRSDFGKIIGWMIPFLTAFVCRLYLKFRHAKIRE